MAIGVRRGRLEESQAEALLGTAARVVEVRVSAVPDEAHSGHVSRNWAASCASDLLPVFPRQQKCSIGENWH